LKIDRSFVSRMSVDRRNSEIVRTVVSLARSLGIAVTAEGIESVEQLRELRALGCDNGQGYLFSGPVDANSATDLIAREIGQGSQRWSELLSPLQCEHGELGALPAPAAAWTV